MNNSKAASKAPVFVWTQFSALVGKCQSDGNCATAWRHCPAVTSAAGPCGPLRSPQRGSQLLHILTNTCSSPPFYYNHLVGMKRNPVAIPICIPLMLSILGQKDTFSWRSFHWLCACFLHLPFSLESFPCVSSFLFFSKCFLLCLFTPCSLWLNLGFQNNFHFISNSELYCLFMFCILFFLS